MRNRIAAAARRAWDPLLGLGAAACVVWWLWRFGPVPAALALFTFSWLNRKDVIDRGTDVLLLRRFYVVRIPWIRVFVHHMHSPDVGRWRHNHPWRWQYALVLRGGYFESRESSENTSRTYRTLETGDWNALCDPKVYHSIDQVFGDCWTLFIAIGPKRRWGFLTPQGHVDAGASE